jgi:hypothetical protein
MIAKNPEGKLDKKVDLAKWPRYNLLAAATYYSDSWISDGINYRLYKDPESFYVAKMSRWLKNGVYYITYRERGDENYSDFIVPEYVLSLGWAQEFVIGADEEYYAKVEIRTQEEKARKKRKLFFLSYFQ